MLLAIISTVLWLQVYANDRNASYGSCSTGMATRRGRRIAMEDRAGAWDVNCPGKDRHYSVWAVFDGHGSASISSYLHAALRARLREHLCTDAAAEDDWQPAAPKALPGEPGEDRDDGHVAAALLRTFKELDARLQPAPTTARASGQQPDSHSASPSSSSSSSGGTLGGVPGGADGRAADSGDDGDDGGDDGDGNGQRLAALRAAAAAAAWDAGSTAVVAVVDWRNPAAGDVVQGGPAGDHAAAAAATTGACDMAAVAAATTGAPRALQGESRSYARSGLGPRFGSALGSADASEAAPGEGGAVAPAAGPALTSSAGVWGVLWVVSLGNSPALLCVPSWSTASRQVSGGMGPSRTGGGSEAEGTAPDPAARQRRSRRRSMKVTAAAAAAAAGDGGGGDGDGRGGSPSAAYVLSVNHELDHEGERRRVEAAGGRVEEPARPGGKRRLMGDLEVSRALGDLQYRFLGLSATPDISGPWLLLDEDPSCSGGGGAGAEAADDGGGPAGCGEGAQGPPSSHGCSGNGTEKGSESGRSGATAAAKQNSDSGDCDGVGSRGCGGGAGEGGGQPRDGRNLADRLVALGGGAYATGRPGCGPQGPGPQLILASDGILEVMQPQEVCDHTLAQLVGAARPVLTPPPPPAIALGPASEDTEDDADADARGSTPASRPGISRQAEECSALPAGVGADTAAIGLVDDGLPGCCDCESSGSRVSATASESQDGPCGGREVGSVAHRWLSEHTAQAAAERLVEEASNRGSMDNMAAIVVQLPAFAIASLQPRDNADRHLDEPIGVASSLQTPVPMTDHGNNLTRHCTHAPPGSRSEALAPVIVSRPDITGPAACPLSINAISAASSSSSSGSGCVGAGCVTASGGGRREVYDTDTSPAVSTDLELATVRPSAEAAASAAGLPRCRARVHGGGATGTAPAAFRGPMLPLPAAAGSAPGTDTARITKRGFLGQAVASLRTAVGRGLRWLLSPASYRDDGAADAAVASAGRQGRTGPAGPGDEGGRQSTIGSIAEGAGRGAIVLVCPQPPAAAAGRKGPWQSGVYGTCESTPYDASDGTCLDSHPDGAGGTLYGAGDGEDVDGSRYGQGEERRTEEGSEGPGYVYLLQERISAVPSMPYHLHAPCPGGDAMPPWQLSDFSGAATFRVPHTTGTTAGWLLDRLQSYYSRPYDTCETHTGSTAVVAGAVGRIAGGECRAQLDPVPGQLHGYAPADVEPDASVTSSGAPGEGGDTSHALMSYGSTHWLLLEIASVPLQLALSDGSSGLPDKRTADSAVGDRPSSQEQRSAGGGEFADAEPPTPLLETFLVGGSADAASSDSPTGSSNDVPVINTAVHRQGPLGSTSDDGISRTDVPTASWDWPPELWDPAARVFQPGPQHGSPVNLHNEPGPDLGLGLGLGLGLDLAREDARPVLGLPSDPWVSGGGLGANSLLLNPGASRRGRGLMWTEGEEAAVVHGLGPDERLAGGVEVEPRGREGWRSSGGGSGGSGGGGGGGGNGGAAGPAAAATPAADCKEDVVVIAAADAGVGLGAGADAAAEEGVGAAAGAGVAPHSHVEAVVVTVMATAGRVGGQSAAGSVGGAGAGLGGGIIGVGLACDAGAVVLPAAAVVSAATAASAGGGGGAVSAGGPGSAIVAGPQLHAQPRAQGVRQADGAVHLITVDRTAAPGAARSSVAFDAGRGFSTGVGGGGTGVGGDGRLGAVSGGAGGSAGLTALAHIYRLRERFGQGHFGEVWRAWRLDRSPGYTSASKGADVTPPPSAGAPTDTPAAGEDPATAWKGRADSPSDDFQRQRQQQQQQQEEEAREGPGCPSDGGGANAAVRGSPRFVLKRLRGSGGAGVLLSGLREAYFGDLLRRLRGRRATVGGPAYGGGTDHEGRGEDGYTHLVDFVESFEVVSEPDSPFAATVEGAAGAADAPDPASSSASSASAVPPDLWLVFGDAGRSLHDLIYSPIGLHSAEEEGFGDGDGGAGGGGARGGGGGGAASFQVLGPSPWWHAMRRHPRGNDFLRELLRQLLLGLQVVHEANITHRDVKPENMMLTAVTVGKPPRAEGGRRGAGSSRSGGGGGGGSAGGSHSRGRSEPNGGGGGGSNGGGGGGGEESSSEDVAPVWLRLIDFGSAVDDYSLQHLYGAEGPTSDELTLEYAPPEALFGRYWEGMLAMRPRAWTYDIWSVGVVWLELLMATPQVWQLPAATRALLEVKLALRGRPESERHMVFLLRGLMEWCIYPPQAPSTPHGPPLRGRKARLLMNWSCTDEALLGLARSRDPLGFGLEGPIALRLLMRLLHWDPASRPSARQALAHAYFTVDPSVWASHSCAAAAMGELGWC